MRRSCAWCLFCCLCIAMLLHQPIMVFRSRHLVPQLRTNRIALCSGVSNPAKGIMPYDLSQINREVAGIQFRLIGIREIRDLDTL